MPISCIPIRGHSTGSLFSIVVVDETRNEYIDRMDSYYLCTVAGEDVLEDITPAVLGDTNRLDFRGQEVLEGPWVGDVVTSTNDQPGFGFTDVTRDYTIW